MNGRGGVSRRAFLKTSSAAVAATALSYARIPGVNDWISIAHTGVGARGRELASVVGRIKSQCNVEMTAVCVSGASTGNGLHTLPRLNTAARPGSFQYAEDLLGL
jgi:hypothetical protein